MLVVPVLVQFGKAQSPAQKHHMLALWIDPFVGHQSRLRDALAALVCLDRTSVKSNRCRLCYGRDGNRPVIDMQ